MTWRNPRPRRNAARADRNDHVGVASECGEGGQVAVVEMQVRDEDGVNAGDRDVGQRHEPDQRADPAAEQGIGEHPDAVHFDEDRRVPR